jgi:hypothetical protein
MTEILALSIALIPVLGVIGTELIWWWVHR